MLADGLLDDLHLLVYPVTRRSGPRLFPEEARAGKLSLAACEPYENGVVYLPTDRRPEALRRGLLGLRRSFGRLLVRLVAAGRLTGNGVLEWLDRVRPAGLADFHAPV